MTHADKMRAQIEGALAKLAGKHGIGAEPAPTPAHTEAREPVPSRAFRASVPRPASIPARPEFGREAVGRADRNLEGRYATVMFAEGACAVYIDTIEKRRSGTVKAYVLRLDTRQREYVTLDRLENVRDEK